jgi:hypothetical protein
LTVRDAIAPEESMRVTSGTLSDGETHNLPFVGLEGATVTAATEAPFDLQLEVWGQGGSEPLALQDNADGNEHLSYTIPAEGEYLLAVVGNEGSGNPYELMLLGPAGTFKLLEIGDEVIGGFDPDAVFDYRLWPAPGQAVALTVTPDNDADVALEVGHGDNSFSRDEAGNGGAETLTFVAPGDGESMEAHVLVLEKNGLDSGHFTLQVAEGSPDDVEPPIELAHFDSEALGLSFDYPAEWTAEEGDFEPFQVVVAADPALIEEIFSGEESTFEDAFAGLDVGDAVEIGDAPLVDVVQQNEIFGDLSEDGEVIQAPEATTVNGMEAATAILEDDAPDGTAVTAVLAMVRHEGRYVAVAAFTPSDERALHEEALRAMVESIELRAPVEEVGKGGIAAGESASDEISSGASHVWHLSVGEGESLAIAVQPGETFDVMVDVRDGEGESLLDGGRVDNAGAGEEEQVEVVFPAAGEYFLYILGFEGSTGSYTLRVEPGVGGD